MNTEVLQALYLINKLAKQDRERISSINQLRNTLKQQLFYTENIDYNKEYEKIIKDDKYGECKDVIEHHNISLFGFIIDTEEQVYYYSQKEAEKAYESSIEGIKYIIDEHVCECKEYEDGLLSTSDINEDTSEAALKEMIQDDNIRSVIWYYICYLRENERLYEEALKGFEKIHELLHDDYLINRKEQLRNHQQTLYSLKDAVLLKSDIPIKEYHRDKNTDDYALAYYEVDGYGFHRITEWTDDIRNIVKPIVVGNISEEMNRDIQLTEDEALDIILDYIEYPTNEKSEFVHQIINGKIDSDDIRDTLDLPESFVNNYTYYDVYTDYDDEDYIDYNDD